MDMTLLVDATTGEHAVGIGVVIKGFLDGLSYSDYRDDVFVAAGPSAIVSDGLRMQNVRVARTRLGRLGFQRLLLPAYARRLRRDGIPIDATLLLDAYAPLIDLANMPYTAFVHDALPLTHGHYWSRSRRLVKSLAFSSLRRTNIRLLTSSKYNAERIHELLGICPDVAMFGCGQLNDDEADRFLESGPKPRAKYVLYIGAMDERKNIHTLVEAFRIARPSLPPDISLLLVGSPRERYGEQIKDSLMSLSQNSAVRLLERVDRAQAVDLIARAAALVFPSHAEGFGLPVLEALAVGTPVVASDIPEVRSWAEATITYAQPTDAHALAGAIEAVVSGDGPNPREGQELARQYRWRTFADAAIAVSVAPLGRTR
jgi:glycosyltransferase involved in cell wall biosynthesis